ncbi:FAD-dependent monooxygenase [Candidatus Colwellia aromaticivorans]|uniref:FAD-dependent monooxygenase n=1 Tax=Candidatus Colwellia aromaticivorans TaxID=2267621 RepID=UPI000DF26D50|nr:FAD-dependent monooxygenase [Candidatus Colwellia aromaticivorans]
MKHFDCVVVGGGMVGAASALTMAQLGLRVALVEQFEPEPYSPEQDLDLRVSAISLASQHLLEQVGAWSQVIQWRACPYKRLGVWEQAYAYTEFNADDIEQKQLGHIVENRLLQLALWQEIKTQTNIDLFCPHNLINLSQEESQVSLTLKNITSLSQTNITAKLVIAADGANSHVRKMVDIGITSWDYQQSAMLINVKTEKPQQDITWQKFFSTGPVAFLPLTRAPLAEVGLSEENNAEQGGYASLVWYHQRDEIKRLSALSNQQLQQEVMTAFPKRLGQIEVIAKGSFPLTRRHANSYQSKRVLLLGDAAHTINPMAGQGVNLGFKDVKALQTVIASAIGNGECWHDINVLGRYESMRRKDNLLMMSTMDALYHSFSHPSSIVKTLRNVSLLAISKVPFINTAVKNKALAYACGI